MDIRNFAACVYAPRDIVEVRQLMNGDSKQSWHFACDLPAEAANFNATNLLGFDVYAGANPRPDFGVCKDENIKLCRCLFADFDKPHFPDGCTDRAAYAQSKAADEGLPLPTMVIDSGHGIHLYWRFTEPLEPARWVKGMSLLTTALGSDTAIRNPERVMRLPGLMNRKPPAAPCRILEHDASRTYTLTDFASLKEPEPSVQPPAPIRRPGGDDEIRAAAYAKTWESIQGGDGRNQALYRHIKALYNDMGLSEAIARQAVNEWNLSNQPPLSDKELQATISNALKYSSKNPAGCGNDNAPAVTQVRRSDPVATIEQHIEDSISGKRKSFAWLIPEIDELTHCLLPGQVIVIVGEPGASKSYWMMEEFAAWFEQGVTVAILEAEKTVAYHLERLAAQRSGLPGLVYPEWVRANPERARNVLQEHKEFLTAFGQRMTDNNQKRLTLKSVIAWVKQQAESGSRLILVDPLTVVDKESAQPWEADKHFIRSVQTIAIKHDCCVLVVLHPTKQYVEPALEHLGGGAAFSQFTDCVLWLYSHKKDKQPIKTSWVSSPCGRVEVQHDRSICILKSRYSGDGCRIACSFTDELRMKSHGIIVGKPEI